MPRGSGRPSARPPACAARHGRLQEASPRARGLTVSGVPTRARAPAMTSPAGIRPTGWHAVSLPTWRGR
eukprot:393216-Alexandrium_andersonii.AAC.1